MGNLSFSQLLVIICFCILVFGDISKIQKRIIATLKKYKVYEFSKKKNRKKGS
jgi:Sec-independent protein translocase protein TatA